MAQNIQIAGATFNAVPSIVVPVAGGGSATFVDPSPTTAAATDVVSGKLFFDALGVLTQGTASGGGGGAISIVDTPDSAGGTVRTITAVDISDTTAVAGDVAQGKYFYTAEGVKTQGTASGGGGGLEYEAGTWTPASDTSDYTISFANTHTDAPFYYAICDADGTAVDSGQTAAYVVYFNYGQLFGGIKPGTGSDQYGITSTGYTNNTTPPTSIAIFTYTQTHPSSDSGNSTTFYPRYWTTETGIRANAYSRTFKAGRTYKWIAIWVPTT